MVEPTNPYYDYIQVCHCFADKQEAASKMNFHWKVRGVGFDLDRSPPRTFDFECLGCGRKMRLLCGERND